MIDVVVMLFVMVFVPVIVELVVAVEAVAVVVVVVVVVACSTINRWLIVGVVDGDGERFELNVH